VSIARPGFTISILPTTAATRRQRMSQLEELTI